MKKKPFSYEQSLQELQSIVRELQEGQINMDVLAEKAQRAAELIRLCREHLRHTAEEINALFPEEIN
jgi:exodeoxyribonuclease VII small subunit